MNPSLPIKKGAGIIDKRLLASSDKSLNLNLTIKTAFSPGFRLPISTCKVRNSEYSFPSSMVNFELINLSGKLIRPPIVLRRNFGETTKNRPNRKINIDSGMMTFFFFMFVS